MAGSGSSWVARVVFAGFAAIAVATSAPREAQAWVEQHVARDDVRVEVEPSGRARIEHRVLLLVSGGPLESMTVRAVDLDAAVEDGAYVLTEKEANSGSIAGALPVSVKRVEHEPAGVPPRTDLELTFDGGKGLSRGRWVVFFRYGTDLAARGAVKREGATTLLSWTGPVWEDGLDTTRAIFALPSAPTEPKAVDRASEGEGAEAADHATELSQLLRRPGVDTLEIVRPYAARGERVTWQVRVDARAIPLVEAAAAAEAQARPHPSGASLIVPEVRSERARWAVVMGGFLLVALLVAAHAREVRRTVEAANQRAIPLLPLPALARIVLAATCFAAGVALQLVAARTLVGSLLVASSSLFVLHRPSRRRSGLRPPGSWLPLRAEEIFAARGALPSGGFELGARGGRLVFGSTVAVFAVVAAALQPTSKLDAILVALDFAPMLALFFPSPRRLVAPDLAHAPIELLAAVASAVERSGKATRVVPRIRLPQGQADADELRLVLLPQPALRGLRAVEVAVAVATGPTGHLLLPEVLVRVDDASPAEAACRSLVPHARAGRGRRVDERVLAIAPKLPDAVTTAELAIAALDVVRAAPPSESSEASAPSPRPVRRPPARPTRAERASTESDAKSA